MGEDDFPDHGVNTKVVANVENYLHEISFKRFSRVLEKMPKKTHFLTFFDLTAVNMRNSKENLGISILAYVINF